MAWQDQGRQQHGWFGDGTGPGRPGRAGAAGGVSPDLDQRIRSVACGAIAALPAARRKQAEAQYQAGALASLTEAMTAWVRGGRLDQASFADRFFGRVADDPVVEKLRAAALGAGQATSHADLRAASENLADAMQAVGFDRWPRFVADAKGRARDPATIAAIQASPPDTKGHIWPVAVKDPVQAMAEDALFNQNVRQLAQIITTEAGGAKEAAMTAVGWAARNRMLRNKTTRVDDVWNGFRHGREPSDDAINIARGILNGSIADPTGGATHFYSPRRMLNKGQPTHGHRLGNLESVPGVKDKQGNPVDNYQPYWASGMEPKSVPSVREADFKFFRMRGNGPVR